MRRGLGGAGSPRSAHARCGFGASGGPNASPGTLRILASDATSLSIAVSGGVSALTGALLDGTYDATRCDSPLPESPARGIPHGARAMETRP